MVKKERVVSAFFVICALRLGEGIGSGTEIEGAGKMAQSLAYLLFLQKTPLGFPVPVWELKTLNMCSLGPDDDFWLHRHKACL